MKDIQEIMKEMNSAADEIAQTLDLGLTCNCNAPCSGTGGISVCGTSSNIITSTCLISIPAGFALAGTAPTIAYSLTSLSALVEQCFCTAAATSKYDVRIIGPIPYVVNLPLSNTGICTSPANASVVLGCSGVANTNNIIGFACNQTTALIANGIINGSLLTCNSITAAATVNTTCTPGFVLVTVTFTLPACTPTVGLTEE